VGRVTTPLGPGDVAIAGIAGDQQSALFGQLCVGPGDCEMYLWDGMLSAARTLAARFGFRGSGWSRRWRAARRGSPDMRSKAASLLAARWCSGCATRCVFFRSHPMSRALPPAVDDSATVVFVRHSRAGRAALDPYAAGMIIGIRRDHGDRPHRAGAIESIAFRWPMC